MSSEELAEQERQLDEIEQLLQASPDDPSLLALKVDLLELIAVTTANLQQQASSEPTLGDTNEQQLQEGETETALAPNDQSSNSHNELESAQVSEWTVAESQAPAGTSNMPPLDTTATATASQSTATPSIQGEEAAAAKKKKSNKVSKEFVVPPHLKPLESDSKAEANRKKRAVKALKSQWKAQKKEQEATQKQKSWQSFQNKSSKKKRVGDSIFATSTDEGAKVGVVGGRQMTDFAKRHKYK